MLTDKILDVIAEVFAEYGEEFTQLAKDNLAKTGELYDSIRFEVQVNGENVSLDILMEDYATFVDKGRRPGKQPPVDAIRSWVRSKGITTRDNSIGTNSADIERTAYVIGRSIGEKGTEGKNFIPEIDEQQIVRRLEQRLEEVVGEEMKKMILEGTTIFQ